MPLDHVQLSCPPHSEALAREFYAGVLGMVEQPKPAALASRGGCWFSGHGADLHLGVEPDFRPARKAHPAIRVADLDAVAAALQAAGQDVVIDENEIPGRRRLHCHDPYGNRLEFVADAIQTWPCGPAYSIRRARLTDVADIVALLRDDGLGREREVGDLTPYEHAFAAIDADPQQFLAVVTDDREKVVGTCQLTFTPTLSRGGALRATLEAVRVARTLRGQGVGSSLMQWAIGYATERGARLLQLTSDASRTQAHAFYARLGFVPSHVGMKLPLP